MIVGPILLSTVRQGSRAPLLDGCTSTVQNDRWPAERYGGVAIRLQRSRLALVIGWRGARTPRPPRRRRRSSSATGQVQRYDY